MRKTPPPEELEKMLAIAQKFDVAGRDERNSVPGRAGAERIFDIDRDFTSAATNWRSPKSAVSIGA